MRILGETFGDYTVVGKSDEKADGKTVWMATCKLCGATVGITYETLKQLRDRQLDPLCCTLSADIPMYTPCDWGLETDLPPVWSHRVCIQGRIYQEGDNVNTKNNGVAGFIKRHPLSIK